MQGLAFCRKGPGKGWFTCKFQRCINNFHATSMKILGRTHILHAKSMPNHIPGYHVVMWLLKRWPPWCKAYAHTPRLIFFYDIYTASTRSPTEKTEIEQSHNCQEGILVKTRSIMAKKEIKKNIHCFQKNIFFNIILGHYNRKNIFWIVSRKVRTLIG